MISGNNHKNHSLGNICSYHQPSSSYRLKTSFSDLTLDEFYYIFCSCLSLASVSQLTTHWKCARSPTPAKCTWQILEKTSRLLSGRKARCSSTLNSVCVWPIFCILNLGNQTDFTAMQTVSVCSLYMIVLRYYLLTLTTLTFVCARLTQNYIGHFNTSSPNTQKLFIILL